MEEIVDGMVIRSAGILGLDLDHPAVVEARQTALEAVKSGYDVDEAYRFARSVMIQAAVPSGAAVEAA